MKYILYDLNKSEDPVYGVYNSFIEAKEIQEKLAVMHAQEVLYSEDDHGLNPEKPEDYDYAVNDAMSLLAIQELKENIDF